MSTLRDDDIETRGRAEFEKGTRAIADTDQDDADADPTDPDTDSTDPDTDSTDPS